MLSTTSFGTVGIALAWPSGVAWAACDPPSQTVAQSSQALSENVSATRAPIGMGGLAHTGADVVALVAIGTGLVVAGWCLLLASRTLVRRRPKRNSFMREVGLRVCLMLCVIVGWCSTIGARPALADAGGTGTGSASGCVVTPPAVLPEAPHVILLPLAGAAGGTVLILVRRRVAQNWPNSAR